MHIHSYNFQFVMPLPAMSWGKGGGTMGARRALAPLKFAEGGLSPPYVMAL